MQNDTLVLLLELLARRSLTPNDAGCQHLLAERLAKHGFTCEHMPFGEVSNLWATHGSGSPTLVLAGHSDVVPPGTEDAWTHPPFSPTIERGLLYARGAADMKSGLAAMATAACAFCAQHPDHPGTLAVLFTSDEEGEARNGTRRVIDVLAGRGQKLDYCLIGEPSSSRKLGDCIRIGRRGSLNGTLLVHGIQGHTAYPEKARNPVHQLAPALAALVREPWDVGGAGFPATSFQISSLHSSDSGANNVTPAQLTLRFNFRFAPCSTADSLARRMREILDEAKLDYGLDFFLSGDPFSTARPDFIRRVSNAIQEETGITPTADTAGGTSDGRFIAASEAQIIELGPVNASIHQVDEHIRVADLEQLQAIYQRIMSDLLGKRGEHHGQANP